MTHHHHHHLHDHSLRLSLICSRPMLDHAAIHRADAMAGHRGSRRRRIRTWARTLPADRPERWRP